MGFDLDVLADQRAEHLEQLADHLVRIDVGPLQNLAAAEAQQLPGEGHRPLGRFDTICKSCARCSPGGRSSRANLVYAADRLQQVVEFVGHAAGQRADGFHLLRLAELLLQAVALGDVEDQAHQSVELAIFAGEWSVHPLAADRAAVLGQVVVHPVGRHVSQAQAAEQFFDLGAAVLRDDLLERRHHAQHFVDPIAEGFFGGRIPIDTRKSASSRM